MSLVDSALGIFTKKSNEPVTGSRSEREAKIKDKAGLVINIFALLLAVNTWYGGKLSSTVMNDTIKANDTYSFYQAKSIKQTLAENALYDAQKQGDKKRIDDLSAKIDKYENEPKEGKKALLTQAKALEDERNDAKMRSPWIGYANTAYQLAIVLLSASILAVNMMMFWSSFGVAAIGLLLSLQGLFLFI
jgi:hypothetical protein